MSAPRARELSDPHRLLNEIEMQHFYRRQRKRWHLPRFYRNRVAAPRLLKLVLNRYPHHTIGAGLIIGGYCYSVKWAAL